ncbi:hypothetical protein P7C71_g116, partial [Lecanoromycetidae sp. Uapishka_2]
MPSVLGKRARAADSSKDESSISYRVKRRAQLPIPNDENADPLSVHNSRGLLEQDGLRSDDLDASIPSPGSLSRVECAVGGRRVGLSPSKAKGQNRIYRAFPPSDT